MAPSFNHLTITSLLLALIPHSTSTPATLPFKIGVLIVPPIQLLDIGPIDLFAMTSQGYQNGSPPGSIPDSDLTISYISHTGVNSTSPTTARLGLQITTDLDDPAVAPGNLSLLMIPGPPPGVPPPEEVLEFVRGHVDAGANLITICSGIWVAAYAGVLDGRNATLTQGKGELAERLKSTFPAVQWKHIRYGVDRSGTAELWTSAGITNGMDMTGVYMREKFPLIADKVLNSANVDVRGPEYLPGDPDGPDGPDA